MSSVCHEVRLGRHPAKGAAWFTALDADLVLSAAGADGPPRPHRQQRTPRSGGQSTATALSRWLRDWSPVELSIDDPYAVLSVATAEMRRTLADLVALGLAGVPVAVRFGGHRFDLADPLDRSLWRLLTARWVPA
jgi:ABC-type thiamine transport system ATPase subunit